MSAVNTYVALGKVVKLDSNISQGCEVCQQWFDGDDIDKAINHYIQAHQYRLLHVGTETHNDQDGKPWHNTVAILGK